MYALCGILGDLQNRVLVGIIDGRIVIVYWYSRYG